MEFPRAKRWLSFVGGAAVEAEHELVEIGREMLGRDRAVVGAEQRTLGEAEHQVDRRQAEHGVAHAGAAAEQPGPGGAGGGRPR